MVSTETERLFVEHLKKAGERLVHPPSNVNELLSLLDLVECCLLWISQPPSKSFENAIGPLKKALAAEDLMRHSDIDVKVAVAACISKLTIISAPAILYDDEQMKRVFRLIVGAFEGLSDTSSRSYSKRVSILESMAKNPSCAVLLNLKCDAMILEMFQHFLKSIRGYHPEHVFSDMETIMTLVLKESDDVCFELLSLLLDSSVGKKDEYVLPIRRKLAKKVITNCVAKFKPNMIHHESVFAAECNGANANASGEHTANGSKSLEKAGADRLPKEANKVLLKVAGSGFLDHELGRSFQRLMTNGYTQIESDDSLTYPSSPQCTDRQIESGDSLTYPSSPQCTDRDTDEAKTTDTAEKIEPYNLESKTVFIPETEPGQAIKKTREVQNHPERSFDSSNNRELDAALKCVEAEDGFALIEPWERKEKTKAAYKLSDEHPANGSKSLEKAAADRIPQEANKVLLKVAGSGFLDDALRRSFQRLMTNGDTKIGSGDSLTYPSCPQKKPHFSDRDTDEAKTTDTAEKIEPHNLESKTVFIPETEPEVQNPPERSFDSSNHRELDAALKCIEAENGFALNEPWERREKTIAAYKADKKMYAIESWENSKKASLEADLKKTEDHVGRKKAEYVEKLKNKVALLHEEAEDKRAMIEAKRGEEILKEEETAEKCRASGTTPITPMRLLPIYLFVAAGGGLLFFLFQFLLLWNLLMGFYCNL